jgi:hypothetical protein
MKNVFAVTAAAFALLWSAVPVYAAGDNNGPDFGGGDVTCIDETGQSVSVVDVCVSRVNADAEAYCGSYCAAGAEARALALCGDCAQFCEGGSAFALAKVKQSCDQSVAIGAYSSVKCGYAAQQCGDTQVDCGGTYAACSAASLECGDMSSYLECPDVDVTVAGNILSCAKVKQLKSGAIRGKRCKVVIDETD